MVAAVGWQGSTGQLQPMSPILITPDLDHELFDAGIIIYIQVNGAPSLLPAKRSCCNTGNNPAKHLLLGV